MKIKILIVFLMFTLVLSGQLFGQSTNTTVSNVPFSKGVNFTGWFDHQSVNEINFSMYSEQDFIDVKNLGADVIRLPINFPVMTLGAPNYIIYPILFRFLDMAVDWAEKHQIYLILDNHHFDFTVEGSVAHTTNNHINIYKKIWAQIAEHYKNRSEYILYELINEPNNITASNWGRAQRELIDIIRRIDTKHTIVVTGVWGGIEDLFALPRYNDRNLLYTFHTYEPQTFTHQGVSWHPGADTYNNIPFPYDRTRMPEMPAALRGSGSWVEDNFKNYANQADLSTLNRNLDRAAVFARQRNVPVFCGEFGAYYKAPAADRVRYYQFIANALDERNIPRISWDYHVGFGIFNIPPDNRDYDFIGDINTDLNVELVRVMGYTPPPQRAKQIEQPRANLVLYDDYFGRRFTTTYYSSESIFEPYNTNAAEGVHTILWGNLSRYDRFFINFNRLIDFSFLAQNGYRLEFKARTETSVQFDVWFEMPENDSSLPWRMRFTIDNRTLPADGIWHTISIPLSNMQEMGAFNNLTQQWMNPRNQFTWRQVQQLVFSTEHTDLINAKIFIDTIRIVR